MIPIMNPVHGMYTESSILHHYLSHTTAPGNYLYHFLNLIKVGDNIIKFLEEHKIEVILKMIFTSGTSDFAIQKIKVSTVIQYHSNLTLHLCTQVDCKCLKLQIKGEGYLTYLQMFILILVG